MYLLLLLVGFLGFVAMAAMGFVHGGSHGHGHSALGHGHGHGIHVKTVGGTNGHSGSHGGLRDLNPWNSLSPLDLFAYALGAGATGRLLEHLVPGIWLPWLAGAGALLFNFGIIKPIISRLMGIASVPSEGLEGTVSQRAEAMTNFDPNGQGIIRLTLDGQTVRLLASLDRLEQERGIRVQRGDPLLIVEVDSTKNTCRVTRELAS